MRTKTLPILCITALLALCLALPAAAAPLEAYGMLPIYGQDVADGTYTVAIKSADPDFAAAAELTASGGVLTAKLTVAGTNCLGLYPGTAAEAEAANPAAWISAEEITRDSAVFSVPVTALDRALDWAYYDEDAWVDNQLLFDAASLPPEALLVTLPDYDRIAEALSLLDSAEETAALEPVEAVTVELEDGEYAVSVDLIGGSGKATVVSPPLLIVRHGRAYARLEWSSSNYDYMIVGTETYWNLSEEGANSVFEIPVGCWDTEMPVIADTTAMGTPHEVSYTLTFYQDSIAGKGTLPREGAKRVVVTALVIIVLGGILNHFLKKRRA